MDRRDDMSLPGSASYYTQRGTSGSGTLSGLHPGMRPLSNQSKPFQSNIVNNSIGSTLPVEQSSTISPHIVNVSVPSAAQPSESVKRKRGRPRKYGPDGVVSLALSPSSSAPPALTTSSSQKRGRGRPPGTGKKQQLASLGNWLSGSAGMGFTPHVITIAVGEDIAAKIMSFSQQGPRAVCVLSANGSVSTVTLHQSSTSGGTVTYEGRFEILCLSGSYSLTHNAGSLDRTGCLSVSLASPDGRVIGGGVGGVLIAATPIQVIMGSFSCGNSKTKNKAIEGADGPTDSDVQTVENPITPTSTQHSQHLNLTSSMGIWPGSRSVDMRNAHVDIDLMRG